MDRKDVHFCNFVNCSGRCLTSGAEPSTQAYDPLTLMQPSVVPTTDSREKLWTAAAKGDNNCKTMNRNGHEVINLVSDEEGEEPPACVRLVTASSRPIDMPIRLYKPNEWFFTSIPIITPIPIIPSVALINQESSATPIDVRSPRACTDFNEALDLRKCASRDCCRTTMKRANSPLPTYTMAPMHKFLIMSSSSQMEAITSDGGIPLMQSFFSPSINHRRSEHPLDLSLEPRMQMHQSNTIMPMRARMPPQRLNFRNEQVPGIRRPEIYPTLNRPQYRPPGRFRPYFNRSTKHNFSSKF